MSEAAVQTGIIHTRIPARLDRLPWSQFHWRILIGLGTVWILDGLEVTMVGTVASRITEKGSSLSMTPGEIGIAGAIYIVGACLGALFFGHLTDRFGRKKLFMLTLGIYIAATFATAFSFAPWWFFLARFVTGAGIGGEYAAINSAIDELIPARVRGQVDLVINGTYWAGSAAGSALSLAFLNEAWFPGWLGWRLAFGIGVVLGLTILLVRRHVPESPRWLFIHGHEEEAERVVDSIESDIVEHTGTDLERVDETLTVRQRTTIPFRSIAHTAFSLYPKRAVLGIALFVGQAFIYNGITFNLGTLFSGFYGVSSSFVPVFVIIYAIGNLLGPLILGRLFDTIGRKPMIAGTYLGSALVTVPLGIVFLTSTGNEWLLIILIVITFFLASAGASAAYLTVSEIFPMETRALAIAFFYAIGTAAGGIVGPLLFGQMIGSGERSLVTTAFYIGAVVMAIGGAAELLFGVRAERASLESIAQPLTVAEAEGGAAAPPGMGAPENAAEDGGAPARGDAHPPDARERYWQRARQYREQAEHAWARAADHRAEQIGADDGTPEDARRRELATTLVEVDELRAQELEQRAVACDELADADSPGALERAEAADHRARALGERAAAVSARDTAESERHVACADAATERARAREQSALAVQAEGTSESEPLGVVRARSHLHRAWSEYHNERATMYEATADGDQAAASAHRERAEQRERQALAAEQQLLAAEHRAAADQWRAEIDRTDSEMTEHAEQADSARARQRAEAEREDRIRRRIESRQASGFARLRPGPGSGLPPLWAGGSAPGRASEQAMDHEIQVIGTALDHHGPTQRQELGRMVGARYWGPGRFGAALDAAVAEGRIRRLSRRVFAPPLAGPHSDGADTASAEGADEDRSDLIDRESVDSD